jgi:hypothetical protein
VIAELAAHWKRCGSKIATCSKDAKCEAKLAAEYKCGSKNSCLVEGCNSVIAISSLLEVVWQQK